MRGLGLAALGCLLSAGAAADYELERYLSGAEELYLEERDQGTLEALRRQDARAPGGTAVSPGQVVFSFGTGQPAVICRVLEITDIAFEPLERIRNVSLGDTARWLIDSAVSGSERDRTEHLIVKPLDTALSTSMLVTTDRRAYHLRLKSSGGDYMPAVSFIYPENGLKNLNLGRDAALSPESAHAGTERAREYGVSVSRSPGGRGRRGSYEISGDRELCPEAVWHDGRRTYIRLSGEAARRKMPAFLEVEREGLIFVTEKLHSVNYRVQGRVLVVDGVVSHGRLTLGERQADLVLRG